ncbi:MAG: hypothetical protein IJ435_09000 [Clostridia bacterium]|nr:hypothetical protein [Clostridia bacterium]
MNDKEKKKALREIIKEAVEKENAKNEPVDVLSDEDMTNSGQELPPEDMLEKIKKAIKKAQN